VAKKTIVVTLKIEAQKNLCTSCRFLENYRDECIFFQKPLTALTVSGRRVRLAECLEVERG